MNWFLYIGTSVMKELLNASPLEINTLYLKGGVMHIEKAPQSTIFLS